VLALVTALVAITPIGSRAQPRPAPGDLVPRIQCPPGYTAKIFAQGLASPDGLAISPAGILHVVEEWAGRVSQIDAAGIRTPVLTGLNSPEGITFDPQTGALYTVEDVQNGRLIERAADGTVTTLANGLQAPEGVTWAGGTLYITESNLEFAGLQDLQTRIAAFRKPSTLTRVITDTPVLDGTQVHAWSYSGITSGPDGQLYVANELSGVEVTRTVVVIPGVLTTTLTLTTSDSVFAVDLDTGTRELFASGLTIPEGLGFSSGARFPLYVVEEDVSNGQGRITAIEADGQHTPFCTGFLAIDDVVVDAQDTLYVSEDGSRSVIVIKRETPEPDPVAIDALQIEGLSQTVVGRETIFAAAVAPISATLPITYRWNATGQAQAQTGELGTNGGLSDTATFTWSQPGPQTVTASATNRAGTVTATHAITVLERLQADFVATPRSGLAPLTVEWANRSTGSSIARIWEFGDGEVSILKDPVHTYRAPGSYGVTLTIVGPAGSDSRTRADYITVLWGSYLPLVLRPS
jgi:glucose/arabinose dehydrogenase